MTTTKALFAELTTLRAVVSAHKAKLDAAQEVLDDAIVFANVPVENCRYAIDLKKEGWRFPAVQAAMEQVERLSEDNGYYWACSRLTDLELLLGQGWNRQVPIRIGNYVPILRGCIPEANPVVAEFVRMAA